MVKKVIVAAATQVADIIRGGPRIDHRESIIVYKRKNEWRIIQPPTPKIEKKQKVKLNVLQILRTALPWINGMNIIPHQRNQRFVDHRVEYYVVRVAFCDMLGLPAGVTPEMSLKKQGFKIIQLRGHPLEDNIKRALLLK